MGIVAYCPHGHRIKVKDHLAGRKGICPECGTRFRIPLESPPELAVPAAGAVPAAAVRGPTTSLTGYPVAGVVSLDADLAATLPRAIPLALPEAGQPPG
jgi:hypothetical protein